MDLFSGGTSDRPEGEIEFQADDGLLRAIHRDWVDEDGTVHWKAFQNPGQPPSDRMSVGAEALATPVEVLAPLAGFRFWHGDRHYVGRVTVGFCRSLKQTIEHTEQPGYFGHCDVVGEKDLDISLKLADSCELVFNEA